MMRGVDRVECVDRRGRLRRNRQCQYNDSRDSQCSPHLTTTESEQALMSALS